MGGSYPVGQMAKALVTAVAHEDARTRARAEERLRRWQQVLDGLAGGRLTIGSRTPVAGLPAWATPVVVRGGFATGAAAAGGPLRLEERKLARRAGVAPTRLAVFFHYLTDAGLAELAAALDDGRYRVEAPEQAALLTVAWLLRAGDRLGALTLIDTIEPFADRLRFDPTPTRSPAPDPSLVWRATVGETREALASRKPNERVEALREALTVWNPFADELLALWLDTVEDGRVGVRVAAGWRQQGSALLDRYRSLAAEHPRCTKHRKPKENLTVLRTALEEVAAGRALTPRKRGLLQHAVDAMLRRRGRPGSDEHRALRTRQSADAARPTHVALARVVADRLAPLPDGEGLRAPELLTAPVTAAEARADVGEGAPVPERIRLVVGRARSGGVEELIEAGVVPSAEVLAGLVPQLAAAATSRRYPDPALRTLMAATYRAFRTRRSLLLLNLEQQVRLEELPWVQAVAHHRGATARTQQGTAATLTRLGELALGHFPATLLPNPLVRELDALADEAGIDLPFVEELAADIFMGAFTAKFLRAAQLAAELLRGTLYERYYGIDYRAVARMRSPTARRTVTRTPRDFAALCAARSGTRDGGSFVAANGMVIEQAQILTTHNLATLVHRAGVRPAAGWDALAQQSLATVCRLLERVERTPRPLRTIKDAAYAWRHLVFYLSLAGADQQVAFVRASQDELRQHPAATAARLTPLLGGLAHVTAGGVFDAAGRAPLGRRLLAWSTTGHWLNTPTPAR